MSHSYLLKLFVAIAIKESNLDYTAIGDDGKAFGIVQIHECVITDVNKRYSMNVNHNDVFNPVITWNVFIKYQKQYGCKSFEDGARLWNGGPSRKYTDKYWEDVKTISFDRERMANGYKRFGNLCRRFGGSKVWPD